MISAGFARTKITPETGLLMGGYRLRREVAMGTHDDLWANCAVIGDGNVEIVLISLDLLCLPQTSVDLIREAISKKTKTLQDRILIACTHTHSGPGTLGLSGANDANDDYLSRLPEILSLLVFTAREHLCNTSVSILNVDVPDVAYNRRIQLKDGSYVINIEKVQPQNVMAYGETDPCLNCLFFETESDFIGVVVNFALHPTVLGEDNYLYSRDYPGYLVDALQEQLRGKPVILFFNGAFGNINQIKNPGEWVSTYEEAQSIGEKIADQILKRQKNRCELENLTLGMVEKDIFISRRSDVSPDSTDFLFSSQDENLASFGKKHLSWEKETIFLNEIQKLASAHSDQVTLQLIQLGNVEIIALPGEVFVELGLEIKKHLDYTYTMIIGNSNGYIGYVPTETSFHEGGYETRLSLTSRLVPKAGEIILKNVYQMRKQL